jgi:hypothetical protein
VRDDASSSFGEKDPAVQQVAADCAFRLVWLRSPVHGGRQQPAASRRSRVISGLATVFLARLKFQDLSHLWCGTSPR